VLGRLYLRVVWCSVHVHVNAFAPTLHILTLAHTHIRIRIRACPGEFEDLSKAEQETLRELDRQYTEAIAGNEALVSECVCVCVCVCVC
jgi:hypothetical protein